MNDEWTNRDSLGRWNTPEQIRVSRRFRYHVRTPSNPKGRIHRELCFNRKQCQNESPGEFHHIDYNQPFRGVWTCLSCHRKLDHGSIDFPKNAIWDYSSLVITRPSRWSGASLQNGKSAKNSRGSLCEPVTF